MTDRQKKWLDLAGVGAGVAAFFARVWRRDGGEHPSQKPAKSSDVRT